MHINKLTTNNTNTTNNIQINNFGNEKLEYLDNEYFKDLIMNNHIQTAYMKLIEDTYLHKDHPENKTIKIENLNSKYGFVFESGKWRPIVKYELKELMHEKNNKLLKIHYRRLKEFLTAAKKSSIQVFFSRIYDHDPHLKLMNDQMVLLFYEGKTKC
jgi:coenzyme F420-reducing hydrogenase alpha subunit